MNRRVVITGRACLTPLGVSPDDVFDRLCAGERGLRPVDLSGPDGKQRVVGGTVPDFEPAEYLPRRVLRALDRPATLLSSAAKLALADSCLPEPHDSAGVVVGSHFSSMRTIAAFDRRVLEEGPRCASAMDFANTVLNASAGQTAILHGLQQVNATISAGASSGLRAIGYATDCVSSGRADVLLAGGVEELSYESYYAFDGLGLLCRSAEGATPYSVDRDGVALSEGVCLLVVESLDSAQARGARILAEIGGHASAFDACPPGPGASVAVSVRVLSDALREARTDSGAIDVVSTSGSGSPELDRCEAQALGQVVGSRVAWMAVKGALGEGLGWGSAAEALFAVESMVDGRVPGVAGLVRADPDCPLPAGSAETCRTEPSRALVHSTGSDGMSCALILSRWEG